MDIDRYKLAILASKDGLWELRYPDKDINSVRTTFWCSPSFRHMLGFVDEEDFPNELAEWAKRLHPDDHDWVVGAFEKHVMDLTGQTDFHLKYRMLTKTGQVRWFTDDGLTLRDADGRPLRSYGIMRDITEMQLQQEQLQHENQQLKAVKEQRDTLAGMLPGAIYSFVWKNSENYHFEYIGDSLKEIMGISAEAGMKDAALVFAHVPEAQQAAMVEAVGASAQHLTPFRFEYYRESDGRIRWFRYQSNPSRTDFGYTRWYGVIQEITEEKLAAERLEDQNKVLRAQQQSLKESIDELHATQEELLHAKKVADERRRLLEGFISSSRDFVIIVDQQLRVLLFNKRYQEYMALRGTPAAVGLHISNLRVSDRDHTHYFQRALEEGPHTQEFEVEMPDTTLTIEALYFPVFDKHEQAFAIAAVGRDVTELRSNQLLIKQQNEELTCQNEELIATQEQLTSIQAELRNKHNELQAIINSTDDHLLVIDRDLRVVFANAAYRRFVEGYGIALKEGDNWAEMMVRWKSNSMAHFEAIRDVVFNGGQFTQVEYYPLSEKTKVEALLSKEQQQQDRFYMAVGESQLQNHVYEGKLQPVYNPKGEVIAACLVARNITAKVLSAQELQHKNRELEATNRKLRSAEREAMSAVKAKELFLANISHELRTPLNGIIGLAELFATDNLDTQQQQYLEMMTGSAENLLTVINDVLDYSKLERSRIKLLYKPIDLHAFLERLFNRHKLLETRAEVKLELKLLKSLPRYVVTDSVRLQQVLNNLLSNALKFTAAGQVKLQAKGKKLKDKRARITLEVSDTGIGISEQDQQLLFEPFSTVSSKTGNVYGGTGLGLSIVHMLLKLMGGSITVNSTPGKGSTFSVEIEMDLASDHELAEEAKALSTSGLRTDKPLHVLVVEDHPINMLVTTQVLTKNGHTVLSATNGLEALAMLEQEEKIDLVLMDLRMPEMGGIEATKAIRASGKAYAQVPIIALTAFALPAEEVRSREAGMQGYLTKPISIAELAQAIEAINSPTDSQVTATIEAKTEQAVELDIGYLEEMFGDEGTESLTRALTAVRSDLHSAQQNLTQAHQQADWPLVAELCHKLAATFGYLSLKPALHLLTPYRDATPPQASEREAQFEALIVYIPTVVAALDKKLRELKPAP